jgi:hypothetical protein
MQENTLDNWRARRDAKLHTMLDPEEPAWLVEEKVNEKDETVIFDIVHRWPPHGWARRRYLYDIVGDVMHFRGTAPLDDGELPKLKREQRISRRADAR